MTHCHPPQKARFAGVAAGAAGAGSVASAHNVCHLLCMAAVSVLSVFGASASSGALMFLEDYNLPLWSMGLGFLALSLGLYAWRPGCISSSLIIANGGLLMVGAPLPDNSPLTWALTPAGVLLVAIAAFRWLRARRRRLSSSHPPGTRDAPEAVAR